LSIVVETVVETLSCLEKRLVSHHLHQLTKQLSPHPVAAIIFERNDELQQLDFSQSADAVLPYEVKHHKLIKKHPVADPTCRQLPLQRNSLIADLLHQLLRVLPRQHLTRLVLL
jgi:hypothetical protein